MNLFKKYNSIENSYNHNSKEFPEQQVIVTEKIDGANIQLYFQPNQEMIVGRRTAFLEPNEKFYDIWNTLEKYKDFIESCQKICDNTGKTLRFFGELYGKGVQKRIDYGEKQICIFDLYINDSLQSQSELEEIINDLGHREILVEAIDVCSLETALKLEPLENTEGFIIQPYKTVEFDQRGNRLILKKKHANFDDKKIKKESTVNPINELFKEYLTENRLLDTFSKHGKIEEQKDIGKYIKLVLEDAKVDFLKDVNSTKFNGGNIIFKLLTKHLTS